MENQMKWIIEVNDESHEVACVIQKTLYEIYVDGEMEICVPRKLKTDHTDSEYDLRIGGKRCQFVIYDGKPDLCVDGILLNAQKEMDQKELRNRFVAILAGFFCIIMSTYATYLWVVYELAGDPIFGGVLSLVVIQIFFFGGVALVITALRRKKREY